MEALHSGDPLEIGGYRLLARLGAGGMGEVFLARTASGRPLALKTVHRDLSREPGFADRFAREIRTSDRVRSPWTVSVVDFSPPGATPQWLATEYVPAPSLADWVGRYGTLEEPALTGLAGELSAALGSVRAAGVVHRDLKPANVLLGRERPFLIDFGIARAVLDPRRTRTGTVVGTPGYLAPEQATGAVAAAPADVFSLAAVLVHAATGHSPFLGPGEELGLPALLYRIVHDEPLLDGVPAALLPLVRQCLAKDPAERPTAEELRARLGAAGDWAAVVPRALVAEADRREAELHALLAPPAPSSASAPPPTPTATPSSPGMAPAAGPVAAPVPPVPASPPATPAAPDAPVAPFAPGATTPSAPPAGASRRRTLIGVAAGAAVLAAAVTASALLPDGGGPVHGKGGGATPPAGSTTPSPTPSGSPGLPQSWAGTWSGTGPGTPDADGLTRARTGEFSVTVTFRTGAVGELVGRQVSEVTETSTGRNLGCTEALALKQINQNTAVLSAVTGHPTDASATFTCPQNNLYVVTLQGSDTLTLESEGAQSAGAPRTLTRRTS
ncbi:serine/threonine-protein kinase [Streptomyces sp. WAC06614]|uniref:serine/threonine-protein kinase n=1 Tax=Streptomyces sp. WAC06614 TaxID=2487416 RepID=UPI000F772DA7|nr:serine/threonine-protein kinase [Streptomyces sp. WAC06614]RSS72815.1 serine/threonine protein kinase [Streptomyces sp. WAC06614]